MKYVLVICIAFSSLFSFGQIHQTWPEAYHAEDVAIIVNEITTPMLNGEIDKVLARTVFPFEADDKKYTKAQLKLAFNTLFTQEMRAELTNTHDYEVMNPDGDAYMLVCMSAPEGYDGAVPVFQLVNGVWMLTDMGLYVD
jgi:hypothetical protein